MKGRFWSQPEGTEFLPAACKALGKAGRGVLPMAWGGGEEEQEEEREEQGKQENRCPRSPAVPASGPGARQ